MILLRIPYSRAARLSDWQASRQGAARIDRVKLDIGDDFRCWFARWSTMRRTWRRPSGRTSGFLPEELKRKQVAAEVARPQSAGRDANRTGNN